MESTCQGAPGRERKRAGEQHNGACTGTDCLISRHFLFLPRSTELCAVLNIRTTAHALYAGRFEAWRASVHLPRTMACPSLSRRHGCTPNGAVHAACQSRTSKDVLHRPLIT